ncbi:MAG: substrate-binding domain-containing protein [Acidovorax sp.]|uniref:substrate-binding domain-containing protein n=1 Tax=Acidovorax sp. TaxID=1872122 RepID=UPI00391932C0
MPNPRPSGDCSIAKAPTIKEVAAAAGVSVATVSRALNASGAVHGTTSANVLAVARQLGFRPNLMGRNLRATRTRTLGVMLPTLNHPVFAECLQGIETQAQSHQQVIAVSTTGYQVDAEERASERLLQQRVDGLILTVADAAHSSVLDKLDAEGVPYVLVFNQPGGTQPSLAARPFVSVDNFLAGRQMVEHLLSLGHQRVHMLAGQFQQSDRSLQRFLGYQAAMSAAGLPWSEPLEVPFTTCDTRSELQGLLGRRSPPTALFCSTDQLAMTVIRDLRDLGLRVPEQVSVAGFDGVQVGEWLSPVLTTVVQPTAEIGRAAVDLLLQLIAGERYLGPALLHHTLRLGGTASQRAQQHQAGSVPPP